MLATVDRVVFKSFPTPETRAPMPKLLCVDDDPDVQTTIEMRMRDYRVEVEHAFYGMQGITETIKNHPDVILMDIAMPNGNGEYLLDCIKRNAATSDIPVVVLTGMRDPGLRKKMISAGAAAFLSKPVAFDELLHTLGQFVDLRPHDQESR
ncbi:Sensor histidine kinase TodS [Posidoniimonas polymericola]|uniref:Sensor histidine kinase TodS n=1 Tax=Posidoniimonas polymericola TaxID=2528002 RepID=A0A5C5YHT4_9BACT|nr:response regulator [Posidoniimonas polymericola]TWT74515.1 Sensor histidine kinase TodS [Posidoniimonas polymericola]